MKSFNEDDLAFTILDDEVVIVKVLLVWNTKVVSYSCIRVEHTNKSHAMRYSREEGTLFKSADEALAYQVMTS